MAFVNLPPNLKDMFYALSDRISKLETQPNQAMTTAVTASAQATVSLQEAIEANAAATQAAYEAGVALAAANGKNTTHYSTSAPSGGGIDGDIWFEVNGATGVVLYQYIYNAGVWNVAPISNTVIANLDAGKINAGTITGIAYNNGAGTFSVSPTGVLVASSATISGTITSTAGSIGGWAISSTALSSGSSRIDSSNGNAAFSGNLSAINYDGTGYIFTGGNITNSGQINSGQSMTSGSAVFATTNLYTQGHATIANAANCFIQSAAGSNYGRLYRSTASSQRYKHDIVNLIDVPELNPTALYNLPVRAFRFNEGYVEATDERADVLIPGFIAEEMDEIYPAAADYVGGVVETWNDRMLIPAMLALIQDQNKRITELENKLNNS